VPEDRGGALDSGRAEEKRPELTHTGSAVPWPWLGYGVGLRSPHYETLLAERPSVDWFEAITENYMQTGGRPLFVLEQIRRDYPIALHGVALSLGSTDPLDPVYLRRLAALVERIEPALVSDHLCWCSLGGHSFYDLLPLPYTAEAVAHVAARIQRVQDRLRRRIAVENPSTYVSYAVAEMREWEFLAAVAEKADCGILLDVNNIYVNAFNHGFDPRRYIDGIPAPRVAQIHLAGCTDCGTFLFDAHSSPVRPEVWDLYQYALRRLGPVSTLIEWDDCIPPFPELLAETERARLAAEEVYGNPSDQPRRAATAACSGDPLRRS